eukprot:scaffold15_cov204-Amphora_coffeaeformis.AAC.8
MFWFAKKYVSSSFGLDAVPCVRFSIVDNYEIQSNVDQGQTCKPWFRLLGARPGFCMRRWSGPGPTIQTWTSNNKNGSSPKRESGII